MKINGEGGIRTLVGLPQSSFRDCRIQPLCHLSKGLRYSTAESGLPTTLGLKTLIKLAGVRGHRHPICDRALCRGTAIREDGGDYILPPPTDCYGVWPDRRFAG